jgi:hypothetical protein
MYEQLDNAVKDLLSELRIDEKSLEVMANGYSPDYPGAVDLAEGEKWTNPHCKVQLSRVVAQKLLASMIKSQPEDTDKVQSVE